MHWIDWCIAIVPFCLVMALAVYAKKYARDIVDFLAAGRVAGRYVICVGDMAAGLSVISLVASCEATYRCGSAMSFWNMITVPLGMVLALTGYCTYRYRATKALSFGQFLEERYSRPFRVTAAVIRNLAEMVTNAIGPAIATNFFIYFLGLPHRVMLFKGTAMQVNLPCFAIIVFICLTLAMVAIWPAGRVSLLITDTFQGLLSYPIFVMIAGYIFLKFNWHGSIVPVMMDRVPGESFINPFDVSKLRDFNMFALSVTITAGILQRASWFGNDTSNSGRNPHEQKMAGVLGTWRNGFSWTMIGLVTLLVITVMNNDRFINPSRETGRFSSHDTRIALVNKVVEESVDSAEVRGLIAADLASMAAPVHNTVKAPVPAGLEAEHAAYWKAMRAAATDHSVQVPEPSAEYAEYLVANTPLSQQKNLDTPYIDVARDRINADLPPELKAEAERIAALKTAAADDPSVEVPDPSPELASAQGANAKRAQKVRTLYGQMMMPMALRRNLPVGLTGLFVLLMIMLLISTDDSRIFNASSTWVQDVILPLFKKPPTSRQHIMILRLASLAVAVFFFFVAIFFSQLDYINMFTTIMTSLWLGGGGSVMIFGLYSRFGNTVGAWCSLAFGSGFSLLGLIAQRTWSAHVIPLLAQNGWTDSCFRAFSSLGRPFYPWIDWSNGWLSGENTYEAALQQFIEKFPMNSQEIYFISMILSVATYCLGSWIAILCGRYGMFNLDKLLHRGEYADEAENERMRLAKTHKVSIISKLVGITGEYTRSDRVIAWAVFCYTIGYQVCGVFLFVLVWNTVKPWPMSWWGEYYYVVHLIVPIVIGLVSTVWFMWGGIRDAIRLFRDLDARMADEADNGISKLA